MISIKHPFKFSSIKFGNIMLINDNISKCLGAYIVIFLLFFTFYGLKGYSEPIPGYMIFLQFFYFVLYTFALIGSYKVNIPRKEFYLFIFIYSILASLLIRGLSWEYLDEPFLGGVDSRTYNGFGTTAIKKNLSYFNYISFLSQDWGIDDQGMSFVIYLAYKITGNPIGGQNLMLLFNALIITGCAWRLEGIMRYFQIEKKISRFCVAVYAFFPFLSLTSGVGLKENFFLFIIISAFYYMFRYKQTKQFKYCIFASLCTIGCIFFRVATFAMIILSFLTCIITTKKNRKILLRIIIIGSIGSILGINIFLKLFYGITFNEVMNVTQYRMGNSNESIGSSATWIIQFLAVIFGPFANFSKTNAYSTVHASGLIVKGILDLYLILGLIKIIKKYQSTFYSIFIYFLMNLAMLVLAGVSLDMRYQITLFPLTLPIIGRQIKKSNKIKIFSFYCLIFIILTFLYNER